MEFIDNGGIRIAYRSFGSGPLAILIHGFPDTEETFVDQIRELSIDHLVVAPRLRGFPPSSAPAEVSAYETMEVADDIKAIVDHFGGGKALIIGHDWGGAVAQAFSLRYPQAVAGLVIMNVPLASTYNAILGANPDQQNMASYTVPYIHFRDGDPKNIEFIVRNIRDPRHRSLVASYLDGHPLQSMLSYYKANYPAPPYQKAEASGYTFDVPVLIVWGMQDEYFVPEVLDGAGRYVRHPLRIVTVPWAGHWVHRDAASLVNSEIRSWPNGLPKR